MYSDSMVRKLLITNWLLLSVLVVVGVFEFRTRYWGSRSEQTPISPSPGTLPLMPANTAVDEELSTTAIFKTASAAVVHITTHSLETDVLSMNAYQIPRGSGTGFVWDQAGHIVTNYHVI